MTDNSMWSGDSYDQLMGRWSRKLAPKLIEFAKVHDGDHVLEVGCGTGSLTWALLEAGPNVRVTATDPSEDYVAINRRANDDPRATIEVGNAEALSYPNNSFDGSMSQLVMNFIPDAPRAVAEMKRLTRPGGYVAAAVWDYGDGMLMLRHLWDEAVEIDAGAEQKHERRMPLCGKGELAALWRDSGLGSVADADLTIQMEFSSFDDYWEPFLTGVGPSGSYVKSLDGAMQSQLRSRLCEKLTDGRDADRFSLTARAWAVRGTVEE